MSLGDLSDEERMTTNVRDRWAEISSPAAVARFGASSGVSGVLSLLMLLTLGAQALAQAPPPGGPASGTGTAMSSEPKLLSALPPPPPDAPPPSSDPRDFEGTWAAPPPFPAPQPTPKLTPKALQKQQHLLTLQAEGKPVATNAAHCRPMDNATIGWDLFPAEIIQSPREIVVLEEEGRGRWIIHMNRGHPTHLKPSYWGDSVGHWENDTLVVDTIEFSGEQDNTTTGMHRISRIRKVEGGRQLRMSVITTDPNTYLEPAISELVSDWHPELQVLEFQCEENPTGALEGLKSQ